MTLRSSNGRISSRVTSRILPWIKVITNKQIKTHTTLTHQRATARTLSSSVTITFQCNQQMQDNSHKRKSTNRVITWWNNHYSRRALWCWAMVQMSRWRRWISITLHKSRYNKITCPRKPWNSYEQHISTWGRWNRITKHRQTCTSRTTHRMSTLNYLQSHHTKAAHGSTSKQSSPHSRLTSVNSIRKKCNHTRNIKTHVKVGSS